jgi:hypothetical protein
VEVVGEGQQFAPLSIVIDYSRQQEFVPPLLRESPVAIVGVGTTGSWLTMMLVRMGFTNITVFDNDVVESHNIPAQWHSPLEIGESKIMSVRKGIRKMGFPTLVSIDNAVNEFTNMLDFGTVFVCTDSVESRRVIATQVFKDQGELVDLRMGLEYGSVLFSPPLSHEGYLKTLEVEMEPEPTCGRRALLTDALALTSNVLAMWLHSKRTNEPLPQRYYWNFGNGGGERQSEE